MTVSNLCLPLVMGDVRLLPFTNDHIEPLRAACAQDSEIWKIYPVNMTGADFDRNLSAMRAANRVMFAQFLGGELVGMTSYINPDSANGTVEIGNSYIAPSIRGGSFNRVSKKLMIEHALVCGYWRIELRVDARNLRSQAAVLKLGATGEGTLRKNRVTWTGHVRDTVLYSILKDEWAG